MRLKAWAWGERTAYIGRAAHALARHPAISGCFSAAPAFPRATANAQIRNCHFKRCKSGHRCRTLALTSTSALLRLTGPFSEPFSAPPQRDFIFQCEPSRMKPWTRRFLWRLSNFGRGGGDVLAAETGGAMAGAAPRLAAR